MQSRRETLRITPKAVYGTCESLCAWTTSLSACGKTDNVSCICNIFDAQKSQVSSCAWCVWSTDVALNVDIEGIVQVCSVAATKTFLTSDQTITSTPIMVSSSSSSSSSATGGGKIAGMITFAVLGGLSVACCIYCLWRCFRRKWSGVRPTSRSSISQPFRLSTAIPLTTFPPQGPEHATTVPLTPISPQEEPLPRYESVSEMENPTGDLPPYPDTDEEVTHLIS